LIVASKKGGERSIPITAEFFSSYRKVLLTPEEVIIKIGLPFTEKFEFARAFKQARRRDDGTKPVLTA